METKVDQPKNKIFSPICSNELKKSRWWFGISRPLAHLPSLSLSLSLSPPPSLSLYLLVSFHHGMERALHSYWNLCNYSFEWASCLFRLGFLSLDETLDLLDEWLKPGVGPINNDPHKRETVIYRLKASLTHRQQGETLFWCQICAPTQHQMLTPF